MRSTGQPSLGGGPRQAAGAAGAECEAARPLVGHTMRQPCCPTGVPWTVASVALGVCMPVPPMQEPPLDCEALWYAGPRILAAAQVGGWQLPQLAVSHA